MSQGVYISVSSYLLHVEQLLQLAVQHPCVVPVMKLLGHLTMLQTPYTGKRTLSNWSEVVLNNVSVIEDSDG